MTKLLIVANWKANKTAGEANDWLNKYEEKIKKGGAGNESVEIAIAGPYTILHPLQNHITADAHPLTPTLASQDLSQFLPGQYTGEVPATLLKELGVKYCLVGHSERRKYLKETNVEVETKLGQAISSGILPIICAQSLEEIPDNLRNYDPTKYLIMYEPSSAISTNGNYHPDSIENIQRTLNDWKNKLPQNIRFLYGGSVSPDNISNFYPLIANRSISGFVVGHASLDPTSFYEIISALCDSSV